MADCLQPGHPGAEQPSVPSIRTFQLLEGGHDPTCTAPHRLGQFGNTLPISALRDHVLLLHLVWLPLLLDLKS